MSVSVLLSTYNGERYIEPLLDSLRLQELPPDEVLIIDDCSSDGTAEIVRNYISRWGLGTWKLRVNERNFGWRDNFCQGLFRCTGDYIFPCDQDDIWLSSRIREMVSVMEREKNAVLLCCDYEAFYMEGASKYDRTRLSPLKNDGKLEKVDFRKGFLFPDRPGCTMCIRGSLLPVMREMHFKKYPHDALAWRAAALIDGLYIFHRKLIRFRRHTDNASTSTGVLGQKRKIDSRTETAAYYCKVLRNALKWNLGHDGDSGKNRILKKWFWVAKRRLDYLEHRNLGKCLAGFPYFAEYPTNTTYFADLYTMLRAKCSGQL